MHRYELHTLQAENTIERVPKLKKNTYLCLYTSYTLFFFTENMQQEFHETAPALVFPNRNATNVVSQCTYTIYVCLCFFSKPNINYNTILFGKWQERRGKFFSPNGLSGDGAGWMGHVGAVLLPVA